MNNFILHVIMQDFLFKKMRNTLFGLLIPLLFLACADAEKGKKEESTTAVDQQSEKKITPMVEGKPERLVEVKDSLLEEINQEIRKSLNQPELYIRRASVYERFGDASSAEEDLNRAYTIDSTNLSVLIAHSDYYLRRGELSPSLAYLKQARYYHPEAASVYLKMGELYLIGKDNRKSLQR